MGKVYHWTPDDVDRLDVETLDWLLAIQKVERELEEQQRQKQEREMKQQAARTNRGRRR
jgi:hypothetical protein